MTQYSYGGCAADATCCVRDRNMRGSVRSPRSTRSSCTLEKMDQSTTRCAPARRGLATEPHHVAIGFPALKLPRVDHPAPFRPQEVRAELVSFDTGGCPLDQFENNIVGRQGVDRRAILIPQYQAISITYRADQRATHAPNNTPGKQLDDGSKRRAVVGSVRPAIHRQPVEQARPCLRRGKAVERRAILTPQYQATSITYRADQRAIHAPNNIGICANVPSDCRTTSILTPRKR